MNKTVIRLLAFLISSNLIVDPCVAAGFSQAFQAPRPVGISPSLVNEQAIVPAARWVRQVLPIFSPTGLQTIFRKTQISQKWPPRVNILALDFLDFSVWVLPAVAAAGGIIWLYRLLRPPKVDYVARVMDAAEVLKADLPLLVPLSKAWRTAIEERLDENTETEITLGAHAARQVMNYPQVKDRFVRWKLIDLRLPGKSRWSRRTADRSARIAGMAILISERLGAERRNDFLIEIYAGKSAAEAMISVESKSAPSEVIQGPNISRLRKDLNNLAKHGWTMAITADNSLKASWGHPLDPKRKVTIQTAQGGGWSIHIGWWDIHQKRREELDLSWNQGILNKQLAVAKNPLLELRPSTHGLNHNALALVVTPELYRVLPPEAIQGIYLIQRDKSLRLEFLVEGQFEGPGKTWLSPTFIKPFFTLNTAWPVMVMALAGSMNPVTWLDAEVNWLLLGGAFSLLAVLGGLAARRNPDPRWRHLMELSGQGWLMEPAQKSGITAYWAPFSYLSPNIVFELYPDRSWYLSLVWSSRNHRPHKELYLRWADNRLYVNGKRFALHEDPLRHILLENGSARVPKLTIFVTDELGAILAKSLLDGVHLTYLQRHLNVRFKVGYLKIPGGRPEGTDQIAAPTKPSWRLIRSRDSHSEQSRALILRAA